MTNGGCRYRYYREKEIEERINRLAHMTLTGLQQFLLTERFEAMKNNGENHCPDIH